MAAPHGDLYEMAKDGTTVPGDAGKQNVIPSVANPHQKEDTTGGLGFSDMNAAADNGSSASGGLGEAVTGTGNSLPDFTTSKDSRNGGKERGSGGGGRHDAALASKINRQEKEERNPEKVL
ncbi:hypothetical protein S7711_02743 [Stachybotrys chartarum IBT 7711]|uniref:Uncharacterized protein n=1 Tax=Stachybotrys chartarum (strain CBS 109288 / IBT 7711) TaxID=1280523 RepID=A0A084ALU9_STACB|nr:hypothetical protein S7711_02743 [Stachybotrys chartarum IBT 7711]KFA49958.1 hypothetical protein S40293_01285 [Stachybotrys chartarum IBT 40293]KFA78716.1 hypothetical protein S40288_01625 [Stachybotrys chartarum IBT 40288]